MILEARHIHFSYRHATVLTDVSLTINKGEVVSVLGPNGSGKSTLLKILLGICPCKSGEVWLNGTPIQQLGPKEVAQRMAYVPQRHDLTFPFTVRDVVLMGRIAHTSLFTSYSREDVRRALNALDRLGILHLKDRPYSGISGGERQLTLIGRALAQGAEVLILDEPITGLDYGNQLRLLTQIRELARDGYTFLKSTHFPDHALLVSSRVILLNHGRVIDEGPPSQVMTAENILNLYQVEVDVIPVHNGLTCCVPRLDVLKAGTLRPRAPLQLLQ